MSLTRAELLRRGFVAGVLLSLGKLAEVAEPADAAPGLAPQVTLDEALGHWHGPQQAWLTWYGPSGIEQRWQLGSEQGDEQRRIAEQAILNSGGSYSYGGLAL